MEQWIRDLLTEALKTKALNLFSTDAEKFEVVRFFENFVYQYESEGTEYILRITHSSHRSMDQVRGELEFIDHLAKGGANVIVPILSRNGELVEKIEVTDGSEFYVISYKKALGEYIPYEKRTDEVFRLWGKTIGQMHRLTREFMPSKPQFKRISWFEDDIYIPENYITGKDADILEKFNKLLKYVHKLPVEDNSYGLIHSDIHAGNIVWDGKNIKVFDFDDAMYQFFISDLAIVFYYATQRWHLHGEDRDLLRQRAEQMITPLFEGYNEEYSLDKKWFKEITTFIKLRDFVIYSIFSKKSDGIGEIGQKKLLEAGHRLRNEIDLIDMDFEKYLK